ncbi:7df222fe-7d67-4c26-9eda-317dd8f94355 [Sclerotinia trifoliorum]|uniref:7df222fe-7d67-4c26-9eda-317dd8f94355 n=1 Tax=Sclerotinia trifoliorum TaxID=28548 RepID=A0A8H2VVG4_9HELO|nr:7df222fe-7d67-4c26-9eda-317dd8f94355 [Sclerotinia trifoliorum]
MSMITATAWVPRGFAAPFPTKYNFDEEEFQRIADLAKLQLDDANEDLKEAQNTAEIGADPDPMVDDEGSDDEAVSKGVKSKAEEDDDLKEYDLDHYDDDVEEDKEGGEGMGMFGNVKSLAYHESNEEDPYITMAGNAEDEDEDREELQILATDNMLLAAKIEDEVAHLEVYVYEDEADNLYVHHDIMLPAIPLCLEWLDLPVGKPSVDKDSRANFVAVGTFDPDIEIWDLDTVDCMYPNAILGQGGQNKGGDEGAKKKKKNKKSKKANDEFHVDAVLSLAANKHHRNLLASSSADKTVKLWDLHTTTCAKSYTHHTDKVCSLAWHPRESTVLLSGSYDRTVVAADMRAPDAKAPRWGVESDVENVRWDPHDPNYFYVSTESGVIHFHDIRKAPANPSATKPVWMLQAHDDSVSAFDINPTIPGFLATGSGDKQVKLWNIQPTGPTMVVSRDLDVGKVFSTTFAPDEEVSFRLAVAGSKGLVQVWDCSTNPGVRRAFADRVAPAEGEIKERLVGVQNDSESEDDDEELEEGDGGEVESMDEDD